MIVCLEGHVFCLVTFIDSPAFIYRYLANYNCIHLSITMNTTISTVLPTYMAGLLTGELAGLLLTFDLDQSMCSEFQHL